MEIIYKIKEIRIERGLSIRELSLKSGVSKSEISYIETGKFHPTVFIICLLAEALNVDARELFDYKVSNILDKY